MRTSLLTFSLLGLAAAVACAPEAPTTVHPPPPPPAQPPPPPPPPPPSGGGTVTVSLTTPNHDDGAILFELTGPATIRSIAPANDIVARNLRFFIDSSSATIRIVAAGLLSNSPLLRFVIADTTTLSSYAATVKDVADSRNVLRSSLTGYALTITH